MSATKAFERRWATAAIDEVTTTAASGEVARRDVNEADLVGRTLGGKFRVDALVGSGAMGNVYRATHVVLDKSVAVKIIRAAYSSNEVFRKRFLHEALTASRFEHPNTVQILDYGAEPDGVTYIVMELLRGHTLADVIDHEHRLQPERIVAVMSQVLSAIATAHDAGIVHRDLKPENVMLVPQTMEDTGEVVDVAKVMDFGVASVVDGSEWNRADRPTDDAIMGTPGYMSPEQLRGLKLDARSDVYACGVILFELLTGRPPFVADSVQDVIRRTLCEEAPHPRTIDPSCDEAMANVIATALRRDRDERFPNARALRAALREAAAHRGPRDEAAEPSGPIATVKIAPRSVRATAATMVEPAADDIAEESAPTPERAEVDTPITPSTAPRRNDFGIVLALAIVVAAVVGGATHILHRKGPRAIASARPASVRPTAVRTSVSRPLAVPPTIPSPTTLVPEQPHEDTPRSSAPSTSREAHTRSDSTRRSEPSRPTVARSGREIATPATIESSDTLPRNEPTGPAPTAAVAVTGPLATSTPHPTGSTGGNSATSTRTVTAPSPAIAAPRIPHGAIATLESIQATAGAPRAPLTSRGQRAVETLGRCASREVSARGATAGLDATRHIRLLVDVRDERLDDLRLQGGPSWLGACAGSLRDSFAGALPAAEDAEYTVTVDIALSPQM